MRTLLAFFLFTHVAFADTGKLLDLGLDQALALAKARNRDLKAAGARLEQSAAGIEQAWTALLPTVSAQGKYTHNYKEITLDLAQQNLGLFGLADVIKATSSNPVQNGAINSFEQRVAAATPGAILIQKAEQLDFALLATVPLWVPFAYPALAAARQSYAAQRSSLAVTEAQVLYQTAQAFFTAAGADELCLARSHAIALAQKTVDDAQARLAAGVVNRVEVSRAELARVRARQALTEAEGARSQAYRALATLLLLREPFQVLPSDVEALADPALATQQMALTLRPEIAALEQNLRVADLQHSSAGWRWAPSVLAFGNVRAFNYPGFSGDNYSWAVGLQLDWLLYDGGARDAQRHLAAAQAREEGFRLQQLRDTITDELLNARLSVDTKRSALVSARRSVELSRETIDLVRVQHDAGTATQLDLLQAQDNLVGAEVQVAQARFDLALADLALRRAAGTFPDQGR